MAVAVAVAVAVAGGAAVAVAGAVAEAAAVASRREGLSVPAHTWEVTPGNKPQKIPQNSHLNGV